MKTDIIENVRHFQFVKNCFELSNGLSVRFNFIFSNSYRAVIRHGYHSCRQGAHIRMGRVPEALDRIP